MKFRSVCIMFTMLMFLSSCASMMNLLPKVPQEQRDAVLAKADKIKFKKPKNLGKSEKNVVKLKKGQWVTTLTETTSGDMDVVLTTMRVISVKGEKVVLETETCAASSNAVTDITQVTFSKYITSAPLSYTKEELEKTSQGIKISKIRSKHGDEPVHEATPQDTPGLGSLAGGMPFNARIGETAKVACETPYLKASICYKYDYKVSVMGLIQTTGTVYAHSDVPIIGHMKTEDEYSKTTVIAFGYRGAKGKI